VWYDPDAVVEHKVFDYRLRPKWLVERAFWQGYSKRVMADVIPDDGGGSEEEEQEFLRRLAFVFVPDRVKKTVRDRAPAEFVELVVLGVLTAAVGLGYLVATVDRLRG
jgi:hypothetical protein